MDLTKLPPSLLLALGLAACTDEKETSTSACLEIGPMTETSTGGTGSGTEVSTSACLDVGPMTDTTGDSTADAGVSGCLDVSTGPCLAPEPTTGTGTDTDTDTDGTTGTGGSDTGTTGNGLDASPRTQIVDRLSAHGILPPDVIARLRNRTR